MLFKILFILSVVLVLGGLVAVYWDSIKKLFHKLLFTEKKPSLKTRLEILTGDINKHFIRRQIHEAKEALAGTGRANLFGVVRLLSILLFLAGMALSVLMKNIFILPFLALGGVALPFIYIKLMSRHYKNKINTDLEDALFAMTYNYMTSDNFIQVVKDNLELMAPTVRPYFSQFVTESTLISADVSAGIHNLKAKINNAVFREWCDCVIQCQNDSTLKGNLLPIVERLSDSHVVQHEVDALLAGAKRNAYAILGMVCFCPLLFKMVPEWFAVYGTNQGKFSIALSLVIILFAVWRIHKLSRPIELEEAK